MSNHPFSRFIDLVAFDQKLQSLETEKITIDAEIITMGGQEVSALDELRHLNKRVLELKKKVDEHELEMKVLDQKEREKKRHLENISDYKAYQAIKAEVEIIQSAQIDQESNVLNAWNQLENAESILRKKTIENSDELKKLQDNIQVLREKVAVLDTEIIKMKAQRAEKEAIVPAEWLEKYVMMRARVVDPVVEIVHQSCGSCSQMITNQEMVRARHGALIQCQKCYRLLYMPEIMEKHAS